jgi:hypothetical protein
VLYLSFGMPGNGPNRMNPNKKIARIIGVLFIVATVINIIGTSFIGSVINSPNWLSLISSNAVDIKIGSLLVFLSALASVSIAICLYPIIKKFNPYLALTAVIFRTIESVFYIVAAVGSLSLIVLGQEYLKAGSPNNSYFQTLGNYTLTACDVSGFIFAVIAFSLGAIAYYVIFYQAKLVPRWLSVWGILSSLLLLIAVFSALYHGPAFAIAGATMILAASIALQEMVLAVWLIVKGFNPSTIASGSVK